MTYQEYRNMRTYALTIDGALAARTGKYWHDVDAGVYDYGVIKAIMQLNGVSYYDSSDTASICFNTKHGFVDITSMDNVPYLNYVYSPYGDFVQGDKDKLKKSDYGAEIILDLIPGSSK